MFGKHDLTRRAFLRNAAVTGAVGAVAGTGPLRAALAATPLVVGFVYVGPRDDYGYNQAHAEAAAALKALPNVKVLEEENVPETVAVEKTLESMINLDGATLLFPTSFGYFDPHMLKLCEKYPKLSFRHCGGLWTEGKHPANAGSYFGYIDECQYISGIVAGHSTKSNKLGFVAAKPIPQVLRNINAFTLGAKSVKPAITTQVIFTGEWAMPVKEAEATNSLADQGVDVVTCHVDSPKVTVETAAKRGVMVCGYHANQAKLAGDKYLTGAEWNWKTVYTSMVETLQGGKTIPNFVRGGIKEGIVAMSPYGPPAGEAARKAGDAAKAEFMKAGGFAIFKGPLKSNKGQTVIAAGAVHGQTDIWLEKMDWLAEGVIGSTG
jgi:simple sugar transport system substrate-binding protein